MKRQERSGSVVVMLFINHRVAPEALWSPRDRIERNGSVKNVTEAWLGRERISTALLLRWCYVSRAAASILLRSWILRCAFTTLFLHFESTALPLRKFWARSKQAPWVGNHAASYTLLLRPRSFYFAIAASAAIHGALVESLKRSKSAVQCNGGFTRVWYKWSFSKVKIQLIT